MRTWLGGAYKGATSPLVPEGGGQHQQSLNTPLCEGYTSEIDKEIVDIQRQMICLFLKNDILY